MKFELLLKNSKIFAKRYNSHLNDLRTPGDSNSHTSVGLTNISLEYYESVIILMERGAYRASGALIRPQYETLVRALYYYHCASPQKAEEYLKGKEPPKVSEMLAEIEKRQGFDGGHLSRFHKRNWKTLNDLTHGGVIQFSKSFTGNELIPNFTDQDRYNLLRSSCLLGATAAFQVAAISGAEMVALVIQDDFHKLCGGES